MGYHNTIIIIIIIIIIMMVMMMMIAFLVIKMDTKIYRFNVSGSRMDDIKVANYHSFLLTNMIFFVFCFIFCKCLMILKRGYHFGVCVIGVKQFVCGSGNKISNVFFCFGRHMNKESV